MTIKLPQENIWTQPNIGDKFGAIQSSFNLDFPINEQGILQVSPRLMINKSSDTGNGGDADLGIPFAFAFNSTLNKWHAGCGAVMFVGDAAPSVAFTQDAATSPPSFEATVRPDLTTFTISGSVYTYGMSAELHKLNVGGTAWSQITTGGTALGGANNGAPLIQFKERLYYRFGNYAMYSIDNADTPITSGTYTIVIDDKTQFINCGTKSKSFIWLGTRTSPGNKSKVYQWDGASTTEENSFEINSHAVLSMGVMFDVPVLIDADGVLRIFNGSAFVELARLPFSDKKLLPFTVGTVTNNLVHYNGLIVDDYRILINVNSKYADTNSTIDEKVPSGVWEYNDTNKLFHHTSPSAWVSGTTTTALDFGHTRLAQVGAIKKAPHSTVAANGNLLVGARYYSDATTGVYAIFLNDLNNTNQKAGYFTTPKIFSDNITDTWQKVYLRFRQFLSATDKIVVKARNIEDIPTETTITYVNTTSFTVAASAFSTSPVEGYEVEILQGIGAGRTVHITAVSGTATLTITVDETITGATTQTTKARFQTWKKLGSYSAQTDQFFKLPIQSNKLGASSWIDVKVWFLWTGKNELHDLIISSKENEIIE